ncbi:MAG: PAS domain S-box protein [Draconibacterium sp.]|nr:PAS domain S-box protein [Draconibacterium sp.]
MNNKIHEKSKQELLHELNELKIKYDAIEQLYHNKIEESRQTERTLQENQANIKAIIENSPESVWSIDLNYNIQYINEVFATSFQQKFGVQLKEGVNILNSLPQHLRSIWKERYDRAFNNEHFVFTDKIEIDNSSVYIEVSMNPIIYDGKVAGASFSEKTLAKEGEQKRLCLKVKHVLKHFTMLRLGELPFMTVVKF